MEPVSRPTLAGNRSSDVHPSTYPSSPSSLSSPSMTSTTSAKPDPPLPAPTHTLRARRTAGGRRAGPPVSTSTPPSVDGQQDSSSMPTLPSTAPQPKWVLFALFSGTFAAMNGVFAKLTTSDNTANLSATLSHFLPFLSQDLLTILLRASFFGLNLASNAVMWLLFTRALTSHPSTTKVSIINTSANFTITAVLGAVVFGESTGGVGGILGLALLVGGCVVLGAKKEEEEDGEGGQVSVTEGLRVDPEAAMLLAEEDRVKGLEQAHDLIDLEWETKEVPAIRLQKAGEILDGTETDDEETEDDDDPHNA